jgi:hypothetical protein
MFIKDLLLSKISKESIELYNVEYIFLLYLKFEGKSSILKIILLLKLLLSNSSIKSFVELSYILFLRENYYFFTEN